MPPVPAEAANGGLGGPNVGGYGHCASEVSLVNTALYYRQAQVMSRAATVLGHAEDAACFSALAERVKAAFNGHFLDETTGVYGSGRQTTSVLPLALGMVPDEHRQAVGMQLVRTVLEKDDGHLDTGIFGTRYLVDALVEAGRPDYLPRRSSSSGRTQGTGTRSALCHHCLGGVDVPLRDAHVRPRDDGGNQRVFHHGVRRH